MSLQEVTTPRLKPMELVEMKTQSLGKRIRSSLVIRWFLLDQVKGAKRMRMMKELKTLRLRKSMMRRICSMPRRRSTSRNSVLLL